MKWSQGLCASILLDGFYSFSPRPRLDPRRGQIFALRRSVLSSRRTRLPPIGASLPRLGAATPRASPQFTSELAIERQHYGLVGDLSRVLRKATPLLVSGPLLLEKLAAFLILNSSERAKV